jgi:hypothetical protein
MLFICWLEIRREGVVMEEKDEMEFKPLEFKPESRSVRVQVSCVDATKCIPMNGPEDKNGLPTITKRDVRRAKRLEKRGAYGLHITCEAYDPKGIGHMTEYFIPPGMAPKEQIALMSDQLGSILVEAGRIMRGSINKVPGAK